jgi:hypothetical protein
LRVFFALLILTPGVLCAQISDEDTFWDRFWVSLQGNFIRQQHGDFYSQYSGPNSFLSAKEHAASRVETLFTGFRITKDLEILADIESAGGAA